MTSPIAGILIAHNVQIRLVGGRLEAIDVNDWGPKELLDWLGY